MGKDGAVESRPPARAGGSVATDVHRYISAARDKLRVIDRQSGS